MRDLRSRSCAPSRLELPRLTCPSSSPAQDADLTQFGVARLLGEFLARLGLRDVTLVINDWGGAQFLLTERFPGHERVARLALSATHHYLSNTVVFAALASSRPAPITARPS